MPQTHERSKHKTFVYEDDILSHQLFHNLENMCITKLKVNSDRETELHYQKNKTTKNRFIDSPYFRVIRHELMHMG